MRELPHNVGLSVPAEVLPYASMMLRQKAAECPYATEVQSYSAALYTSATATAGFCSANLPAPRSPVQLYALLKSY